MAAFIGSSSSHLKLLSSRGFPCVRDASLRTTAFKSLLSFNHNYSNNRDPTFKLLLSISSINTIVRPHSLSSSHTQAEIDDQELQLEKSHNQNTNEVATVRVKFQLQRRCSFGQHFLVVGDDPLLGSWDPKNAVPMKWSDGHVWTADVDLPIGKCIKFKFIMQEHNKKFIWQPGHDRIFEISKSDNTITLCEDWVNPKSHKIMEKAQMLNQTEESTITPKLEIVPDQFAVPAITDGTPDTMAKSINNVADSEVKKIDNNRKENSVDPKGYATNSKRKSGSRDRVPVLVPSLRPLPTTNADQEGEPVNEAPTMVSMGADEVNA